MGLYGLLHRNQVAVRIHRADGKDGIKWATIQSKHNLKDGFPVDLNGKVGSSSADDGMYILTNRARRQFNHWWWGWIDYWPVKQGVPESFEVEKDWRPTVTPEVYKSWARNRALTELNLFKAFEPRLEKFQQTIFYTLIAAGAAAALGVWAALQLGQLMQIEQAQLEMLQRIAEQVGATAVPEATP